MLLTTHFQKSILGLLLFFISLWPSKPINLISILPERNPLGVCFSDDSIYQPGDGKTHRGKAEIRAAFEPQFNGAFGAMRFDENDRLFDAEKRKRVIRWVCR